MHAQVECLGPTVPSCSMPPAAAVAGGSGVTTCGCTMFVNVCVWKYCFSCWLRRLQPTLTSHPWWLLPVAVATVLGAVLGVAMPLAELL